MRTHLNDSTGGIESFWLCKDLFPVWLHGDFHARNALLVPNESGRIKTPDQKRWELKIIDLAKAETRAEKVAMVFDFVTFEVNLKAEILFDLWAASALSEENESHIQNMLDSLIQSEKKVWAWCRKVLPYSTNTSWQTNGYTEQAWSPPRRLPELSIPEYKYVALWRHLSLFRMQQAARRASIGIKKLDELDRWTPLLSYAQALFFHSIAYLEFLEPKGMPKRRALTCLASAAIAAEILTT